MKKFFGILLACLMTLPLFVLPASAADAMAGFTQNTAAATAYADFSTMQYGKLTKFAFGDDATTGSVVSYQGRTAAQMTAYLYIGVDDAYIPSTVNNVSFRITYFDSAANGYLKLQYNSNDPAASPSQNYTDKVINMTGSGTWVTAQVDLTNVSFRNAQNGACDFRIIGGNVTTNYISKVEVFPTAATASITFDSPIVSNGLALLAATGDNQYHTGTAGGQAALLIDQQAYFQVTDAAVKAAADLTLEITYFDSSASGMNLQYSSSILNNGSPDKYHTITLPRSNSGQYITTDVTLASCNFAVTENYGGHFRIGGNGVLRSVKLTVGAMPDDTQQAAPSFAPQTTQNNMIGKSFAGYQAWFKATSNTNDWVHWGSNGYSVPQKDGVCVEVYPDVKDYAANGATLYNTNLGNLGNGSPSQLFNSTDDAVIGTHFQWMQQYGIDGAAVQRFVGSTSTVKTTADSYLKTIQQKAEQNGRLYYIMYDLSGGAGLGSGIVSQIELDFVYNIENKGIASSPNYAHANGKPVVCLWGVAGNDPTRYPDAASMTSIISWFKARGYYVIGGLPDNDWYTRTDDFAAVYKSLDMVSPWTVGRYSQSNSVSWQDGRVPQELAFCNQYGIAYQPVVFPGFAWTNMKNNGTVNNFPRNAGQFMWQQVYNLKSKYNCSNLYFAMFDEYDEGTAYMKAASDYFDIPTNQYFLTMSADGTWLSSDYYLRAAGAATAMAKGTTPLRANIDIPYSNGPVYFRNSFESKDTTYTQDGKVTLIPVTAPVDVCLHNPSNLTAKSAGVTLTQNAIVKEAGRSGDYLFRLAGNATNATLSKDYYQIDDAKIPVTTGLTLEYSLKPGNAMGQRVFVDLLFSDGTLFSESNGAVIAARGTVGSWTDVSIPLSSSLIGKTITGIVVGYSGAGTGSFSGAVDNIILETTNASQTAIPVANYVTVSDSSTAYIDAENGVLGRTAVGFGDSSASIRETAIVSGRPAIHFSEYLYVKVDDSYITPDDNNVTVKVTYLDSTAGATFKLQYNAIASSPPTTAQNYTEQRFTLAGTGTWQTQTFTLSDASFRNAQNQAADLRLNCSADIYVSRVDIIRNSAAVTFDTGINESGIHVIDSSDAANSDTKHQMAYVGTDPTRNIIAYMYCQITDPAVKACASVKVTVTYYDIGTENLNFQYNSTSNNYQGLTIAKTNTGALKTATLTIADAAFAGKQNNGADFRMNGGNAFLKSITVTPN